MLENNPNKIKWDWLCFNRNAIDLLEKNLDKIDLVNLSNNPSIFTYDYEGMKNQRYSSGLVEQLMQNRFHPRNIEKFEDWGFESVY